MVFWHGMSAIKRFIDIAGPAVYVVMLALAGLYTRPVLTGSPLPSPANP
jgi:cytosine/uracil/thiamine/allantoin permease